MSDFTKEMKKMSADDIELILSDQKELFTDDEIQMLVNELPRKLEQKKIDNEKIIPDIIKCPKCDAPTPTSESKCKYCEYKLDITKIKFDHSDEDDENIEFDKSSNISLFVISLLLPIIGIILGIVYIGKNDEDLGKSLIYFSIFATVIYSIILYNLF
ncbi:MAG: hypothetical protein FWG70_05380 [Oscillospiraceae bacterium]|nr:hypothetical protein [Oscillospiraceae bacterium]